LVLVVDRALVGDVVKLVLGVTELSDEDLVLERVHLVGEDAAEILRIQVRQRTGVHVLP
jgi:hypothetical protein